VITIFISSQETGISRRWLAPMKAGLTSLWKEGGKKLSPSPERNQNRNLYECTLMVAGLAKCQGSPKVDGEVPAIGIEAVPMALPS
jgi:hypothetical protein